MSRSYNTICYHLLLYVILKIGILKIKKPSAKMVPLSDSPQQLLGQPLTVGSFPSLTLSPTRFLFHPPLRILNLCLTHFSRCDLGGVRRRHFPCVSRYPSQLSAPRLVTGPVAVVRSSSVPSLSPSSRPGRCQPFRWACSSLSTSFEPFTSLAKKNYSTKSNICKEMWQLITFSLHFVKSRYFPVIFGYTGSSETP